MKNIFFSLIGLIQLLITVNSRSLNITITEDKNINKFGNINTGPFLIEFYDVTEVHELPYKITENKNWVFSEKEPILIDGKPKKSVLSVNKHSSINEYYRKSLNVFERVIYDGLAEYFSVEKSLTGLEYKFINLEYYEIPCLNYSEFISRGIHNYLIDHPDVWYFQAISYTYDYILTEDECFVSEITFSPGRGHTVSEINKINVEIREVANKIAKEAKQFPTIYEQLLYIHDYLVKNIKYAFIGLHQTIYGALIDKHCVCAGYAHSFTFISRLLGVDVITVSGNGHAWNFVNLDSNWYAVDATWDDPGNNYVGDDSNLSHNYFLVGSETIISGKRYIDNNIRKLSEHNKVNHISVFPTLSKTEYKVPSIDPEEYVNYEDCKKRLDTEVEITIKTKSFYNNELYHHVCAPSMKNACRYRFDRKESGQYYENFLKCSDALNKRLVEIGITKENCFLDKYFSKDKYCKENGEPPKDPEEQMDYERCKKRINDEIFIEDKRNIKYEIDELAHAVCAPTQGNYCRYRFNFPNKGPNYGYYLKCTEEMNKVLKNFGHNKKVCFTHKAFSNGEKKCYSNGRDSNDEVNFEQCKKRIVKDIYIESKGNFKFNIEEIADKACKPSKENHCRYHFDSPDKEPYYENFLRCSEDINNILNDMGNDQEICYVHKEFSKEKKCYDNVRDPKNDVKIDFEKCKKRVMENILIELKGNFKFDINEIATKVCAQKKGNHCRYHFGNLKEDYDNYIECTEDINNILYEMGNDQEVCFLFKNHKREWQCYSNHHDPNQQMNYEQCKDRIKNEIKLVIGGKEDQYDLEELTHRVCLPNDENYCRYRFDYPNNGPNFDYYLKCTETISHVLKSWGIRKEICFFNIYFSDELNCFK